MQQSGNATIKLILPPKSLLGPCFGVQQAFDFCLNLTDPQNWILYQKLAHNQTINQTILDQGIQIIDDLKQIKPKQKVLLGAHGTHQQDLDHLRHNNIEFHDLVCPKVAWFLEQTLKYEQQNYQIIIIGDQDHKEIKNICSHLQNPIVIKNKLEADQLPQFQKIASFSQTTEKQFNIDEILPILETKTPEQIFTNTRCRATQERQGATTNLAQQADLMIIATDHQSRNGNNLLKIAQEYTKSIIIQNPQELENINFKNIKSIGLIASASTPRSIVNQIIQQLNLI